MQNTHTNSCYFAVGSVVVVRFLFFNFKHFTVTLRHTQRYEKGMQCMTYETFLVWSLSFSFLFLLLLLMLPPAVVCVCAVASNFQMKHQIHDTPNYFTCSNFWLSFCDFSLCLSTSVCLFVWQLCNHFIRTDFVFIVACCLPFYLLFFLGSFAFFFFALLFVVCFVFR